MQYTLNTKSFKIYQNNKITVALKKLNTLNPPILFVVNNKDQFVGTVTDGDIRRYILNKKNLNNNIEKIVNKKPFICNYNEIDKLSYFKKILYLNNLKGIPIIKSKKLFAAFLAIDEKMNSTPIVIMAGGMGKRLLPLTKKVPKPLLKINGKAILQYIIENIIDENFNNIYVSINFQSKKIKDFFKLNKNFGLNVKFLEERKPLGTAGSLYYLKNKDIENNKIIIINGDILTDLKLNNILSFHKESNNHLTMGCMNHQVHIPFGVIKSKNGMFVSIDEKPYINNLVNSGIYVINKNVLNKIKKDKFTTMLDVIEKVNKQKIGIFPLYDDEDWIDLGNKDNFLKFRKNLSG